MERVANIRDVNKHRLTRKLWYRTKWRQRDEPAPFYDENEANEIVDDHKGDLRYVQVCGKLLWVDLSKDPVDYENFDLRNGAGAFNAAVEECREQQLLQDNNTQPPATEQSTTAPLVNTQADEEGSEDDSAWGRRARIVHKNQGRQ
ncbi:hypothetical protein DPV78_012174 [Talaromyces pinophilus]|nr:hypothetical protein DPV78_012174 [Talaromyces pinophilus]